MNNGSACHDQAECAAVIRAQARYVVTLEKIRVQDGKRHIAPVA